MIGIDYFALAVFAVAFLVAQVRSIPVRVRYGVLSLACAIIAVVRLRGGAAGTNLLFVAIAIGLAVFYAVKAMRAVPR